MDDRIASEKAQLSRAIDSVILSRRTVKVIANATPEVRLTTQQISEFDQQVKNAISVAGWAPFHYDRKLDSLAEPWRFTVLFHQQSRAIADHFFDWFSGVKPNNKIPRMLAACGATVLVTWLPETGADAEKLIPINEEHLAAAAAATQNLLLALESRGLGTYWSSGGQLGSPEFFERYSINPIEKLIAAIFIQYPGMTDAEDVDSVPGKNREKRSHLAKMDANHRVKGRFSDSWLSRR